MCYTGKCPYEYGSGEGAGECRLKDCESVPDDAECVLMEKRIDEYEKEHPIGTAYQIISTVYRRVNWDDEIIF